MWLVDFRLAFQQENPIGPVLSPTSLAGLGINTQRKIHKEKEVKTVVEEDGPTWMTPIMEYLKERTLPNDRKEARKLRIRPDSTNYWKGFSIGGHSLRRGDKKPYGGIKPLCPKCNYHPDGPCTQKCTNCKKTGHWARDCKSRPSANNNNNNNNNQRAQGQMQGVLLALNVEFKDTTRVSA
nr:reverse transcriptase domain-containing protein [Tanacetum cinerariifolium]